MALQRIAGSKIDIGGRMPYLTNPVLADFAGQAFTEIADWQTAGDLGAEQEALTQTLISTNATIYGKGVISFPIMSNVFSPKLDDEGQIRFVQAQRSCKPFAFRIRWGADCGEESEVTISSATPGVVSWVGHGLPAGTPVVFSTSGALPAPLVAGTVYFVVDPDTDDFSVAATSGGAAINTTTAGTGIHVASAQPEGETDLLIGFAMYGTKTGGDASGMRLLNFPIQPISHAVSV